MLGYTQEKWLSDRYPGGHLEYLARSHERVRGVSDGQDDDMTVLVARYRG
jgi:hypothetical protein